MTHGFALFLHTYQDEHLLVSCFSRCGIAQSVGCRFILELLKHRPFEGRTFGCTSLPASALGAASWPIYTRNPLLRATKNSFL